MPRKSAKECVVRGRLDIIKILIEVLTMYFAFFHISLPEKKSISYGQSNEINRSQTDE